MNINSDTDCIPTEDIIKIIFTLYMNANILILGQIKMDIGKIYCDTI